MKTLSMIKTISFVALTACAGFSMAGTAQEYGVTAVTTSAEGLQTMTVSFADLDLSSAKAQETLYFRLSSAARKVCGSTDIRLTGSVRQAAENKSCYNNTLAQALSHTASYQVASLAD